MGDASDSKNFENRRKKIEAQVFLAFLLAPVLAGRPCFCLVALVGLTVGLAIGGVGGEAAVGLAGKVRSSFQLCCISLIEAITTLALNDKVSRLI